ncbi:MAG: gamma carbonic anhydrase family protein [Gammaproteobacteria bacterium]|nr:gamma carbonic anhydrase family protein [Gammaproteobacteria bacterium]
MTLRSYQGISPLLATGCYVDEAATVIGAVTLGRDSSVWPGAVVRADVNTITIGARTNIQDGAVLHVTHCRPASPAGAPLVIGDEVTIGHNATLHGCTIGNQVLIGMGAVVLDGAVIEDQVLLGAAALVTPGRTLRSGYLYAGSPVREMRPLRAEELENFAYSAANYVRWKEAYRD